MSEINRRDLIKTLGLSLVSGIALTSSVHSETELTAETEQFFRSDLQLDKPVTAITLGAGARGNVYGNYAVNYPKNLDIVGVAEPIW